MTRLIACWLLIAALLRPRPAPTPAAPRPLALRWFGRVPVTPRLKALPMAEYVIVYFPAVHLTRRRSLVETTHNLLTPPPGVTPIHN